MSQIDQPPSPADITAQWLTRLLSKTIQSVTAQTIGTGQVGATYRFNLSYEDRAQPSPQSLIGKFMSDDAVSRATGVAQLSYVREVNFYRHYGDANRLPIADVAFSSLDPNSHEFALIMEDFPGHYCGNQLTPATLQEAELALRAAAQIHAAYWNDPGLDTHAWLNGSKAVAPMNVDALYAMLWPAFCDRYKNDISVNILTAGEAYVGKINEWIANRTGPRCLTHGDFRPDNMLFQPSAMSKPIVIVDWQTAGVGNGATDIAYYLGTALNPETRRENEERLVECWVRDLIDLGVSRNQTDDLWDIYRRDAVSGFIMGVLASMIVAQTDRGDRMFLEMCARSAMMIYDHKSMDLI